MYEQQVRKAGSSWTPVLPSGVWRNVSGADEQISPTNLVLGGVDGLSAGTYEFRVVAVAEVQVRSTTISIRSAPSQPTDYP
eukprot:3690282-Prymnesium_polylepis.1